MSEPRIEFRDTWPADVSIRADAELGRAWRHAEAALPDGSSLRLWGTSPADPFCEATACFPLSADRDDLIRTGLTPADALNALGDALETDLPVDDAASPTDATTSRPDAPE